MVEHVADQRVEAGGEFVVRHRRGEPAVRGSRRHRCAPWSSANGCHFDEDVVRGPGHAARLEAEPSDGAEDTDVAEDADDLTYDITCRGGRPRAERAPDD
ncbi:hypothetical protein [Streptomyces spectabilis]|uniref:hypothetical protein n=1 Tax=Streptomyces spectabilis TaxID=68270 RepID=UPI001CEF9209|nr:hypothetical protein [Streptomyces spectabilis]